MSTLALFTPKIMTNLERNIEYIWCRGDVSHASWLCLPSFKNRMVHIQVVKDAVNGEYHVRSLFPAFDFKGFDIRYLLKQAFVYMSKIQARELEHHQSTITRTIRFFDYLEQNPRLF